MKVYTVSKTSYYEYNHSIHTERKSFVFYKDAFDELLRQESSAWDKMLESGLSTTAIESERHSNSLLLNTNEVELDNMENYMKIYVELTEQDI